MILVWVARTLDPEQQDGEMADLHNACIECGASLAGSQLACFGCTLSVSTGAEKGSREEQLQVNTPLSSVLLINS